jgi:hypothetical protein
MASAIAALFAAWGSASQRVPTSSAGALALFYNPQVMPISRGFLRQNVLQLATLSI